MHQLAMLICLMIKLCHTRELIDGQVSTIRRIKLQSWTLPLPLYPSAPTTTPYSVSRNKTTSTNSFTMSSIPHHPVPGVSVFLGLLAANSRTIYI